VLPEEEVQGFLSALDGETYADAIEGYWRTIAGDAHGQRLVADLRATPPDTVRTVFRALTKYDPAAALRGYAGPRRLVQTPNNDAPFSLQHLVPGTPFELVDGTGHWLHIDRPDAFARVLDAFLAEVDARSR